MTTRTGGLQKGGVGRKSALPSAARGVRTATKQPKRRWIPLGTAVLAVVALVLYGFFLFRGTYASRSPEGIGFGIAAAVALLTVMVYSVRRGLAKVRKLGRTAAYLDLHVWVGLLFLLLFLIHSDFRLPGGVLTGLLWGVSVWVVASGVVGTLLQRMTPKILDDASSLEVHFDRIPELVDELRERAEKAVKDAGQPVRDFYRRELAGELQRPQTVLRVRPGRTVAQTFRSNEYDILKRTVDEEGGRALDELQEIHRAKMDMDLHYTLQLVLRTWLLAHLPVAVLLIGLVVLHVFFVLYF